MRQLFLTFCKIKYKWSSNKSRMHATEANTVRSSRRACFDKLVFDGWIDSSSDAAEALIYYTFERCGIAANAARDIINGNEGFDRFHVVSTGCHYVLESQVTGLIYDLVSTEGLLHSDKLKLSYTTYLHLLIEGAHTKDELILKFKADHFSDFLG